MQALMLSKSHFKMKLICLLAPVALLSACNSVGPEYKRPELAIPAQYEEKVDQVSDQNTKQIASDWWTLYQDKTLNDLISKALKNNTDIKLAVARIEEADAFAREVGAYLYPQVDLTTAGNRTRVTESGNNAVTSNNPRSNYRAFLSTSYELDVWGKVRSAEESALAQALSSRYAKDTVVLSISGLVANNYLVLRGIESQITITQDNIVSRDASLALTKRRLEGGLASALDVHQAEVASSNLKAQLAELKKLRALSLHQLALLTGVLDLNLAATGIDALLVPPTPPAGLPSSLLEARPDVRQAEELMVAANADIGVAKAALYPTISLTAGFGGESSELSDVLQSAARIWTGGLSLYLPIFDSGKLDSRVDQATARQKQVLASYEGVVQNAFEEVNDALVKLRQNTELETELYNSQTSAKKALEISENRYKAGYSAYLDVLDAQRVYNTAALAFIQSRQARFVSTVELFKALGGGWQESAGEPVKQGG